MQYLSLYYPASPTAEPSPERMEAMGKLITEMFASGKLIATGGVMKRDTNALTISLKNGRLDVVDGAAAAREWMSAGGFAVMNADSRDELVNQTKRFMECGGEGTCEMIALMTGPPPEAA